MDAQGDSRDAKQDEKLFQDAVDAKRYRFLRDANLRAERSVWCVDGTSQVFGDDLDSLVNMAMEMDATLRQSTS